MKNTKNGFVLIGMVAIVLVITILAVAGWYVYTKHSNPNLDTPAPAVTDSDAKSTNTITYSVTKGVDVIQAELSKNDMNSLTKEEIREVLNAEFEWQDRYSGNSNDRGDFLKKYPFPIDYIKAKLITEKDVNGSLFTFTEDEIDAIYEAENIYLIEIGAIDPAVSETSVKDFTRVE